MISGEDPILRFPVGLRGPRPAENAAEGAYRFVETPSDVFVGVSFATEEARGDAAPSVESREEELRAAFRRLRGVPSARCIHRVEVPVRLDASTPIDWEDYEMIERGLDSILSREAHSVGRCLVAGHAWLGMLIRMVQNVQASSGAAAPGSAEPSESPLARLSAVGEAIRYYVEHTRADDYARAFAIASRSAANAAVKRMALGTLVGFRRALRPRQWKFSAIVRNIYEYLRHWMRAGALRFPGIEGKVAWRDFAPSPADLESPDAQRLLRRYFRHALFRKDPILHTDLFLGFCFMVLVHGLVEWYAAALAKRAARASCVSPALESVERHFVLDPDFGPLFLHHPAIGDVIHHVARRPNFAHTIIEG